MAEQKIPALLRDWPADLREWYEERAAIREFDGGQSRIAAERGAQEDVRRAVMMVRDGRVGRL